MKVEACPKKCTFDWKRFHLDLDIAMAHLIEEADHKTPFEEYAPSKVSLIDMAMYATKKLKLQEARDGNKK